MILLAEAGHNPVLPASSELIAGLFGIASFLVPILIVAFIVRQAVLTRRAAERAAEAAERVVAEGR